MNYFLLQNKKAIAVLVLICLLAFNYSVVVSGLDSNFFGILFSILLFVIGGRKTSFNMNYPLLGLILLLEFVSFRLHTKSSHFLALALFVCLVYYLFTGKFSFIALICVLLFSSVFNTFFNYLTTEIKQTLCYGVFLTLKNFIPINKIEGVNFYLNNAKITIDTACMGLSLFKTGLLSGAFLLTLEERKQKSYFSIMQIFVFCLILIVLNIISNYFRIVTLVLLNCTRENVLHHSIGIACFILYQIVPMLFIMRFFKPKQNDAASGDSFKFTFWPFIIATAILCITSFEVQKKQNHNLLEDLNPEYQIQKGKWVTTEVFKIVTPEKLVYIKTPSHNPLICWTGDGYTIIESQQIKKNKEAIWLAKLEKNKIRYSSYWWYECDHKKYTSLAEVLLIKLIYNKPVRLINETSKVQ